MFSAVFSDELGEDYNGALSVVASRHGPRFGCMLRKAFT